MRSRGQARQVVDHVSIESVSYVVVAVAIVAFDIRAVLRQGVAPLSTFIQAVAPGIGGLGAESMPTLDAQHRLERVVVGVAYACSFVDCSIIRKGSGVGTADLLRI